MTLELVVQNKLMKNTPIIFGQRRNGKKKKTPNALQPSSLVIYFRQRGVSQWSVARLCIALSGGQG